MPENRSLGDEDFPAFIFIKYLTIGNAIDTIRKTGHGGWDMKRENADIEIVEKKDNRYVVRSYHDKLSEAVGRQYAVARKDKGLTQQQVADVSGVKRPNIARLEGGKHSPTVDMLARVAASMGMQLEISLVDREDGQA